MFKVLTCAVVLVVAASAAVLAQQKSSAGSPPPTADTPLDAVKAADPEARPLQPGEAVKVDLEKLDATIQSGLEELKATTADFAAERQKWKSLDRSMASARAVNKALLVRNKSVVGLYEAKLQAPLGQFKDRLKEAPVVYRKMAEERRAFLGKATLEMERRNYLAMAETCEAAATLCERRREEIFGEVAPEKGFGNRGEHPNAVTLQRTIANMKKLQPMHEKWEETFAAYPTVLDTPGLANWFETLSLYAEDLDAFTRSVEGLKDAMKHQAARVVEERNVPGKN